MGGNDAYGKAARVLIDDNEVCYGCLDNERLKLFKSNTDIPLEPFSRKCGSTYTPYNSGISNIAAALVQEACLVSCNTKNVNFLSG